MNNSKRNLFRSYLVLSLFLLHSFTISGCGAGEAAEPSVVITISGHRFRVEIADSPEERERGYMEREDIEPDQGMLFVFPGDRKLSFWMKNTPTPLSIAYIDSEGYIREIHDMEPYSEKSISSLGSVRYALEVLHGRFQELGISVGDKLEIEGQELPVSGE